MGDWRSSRAKGGGTVMSPFSDYLPHRIGQTMAMGSLRLHRGLGQGSGKLFKRNAARKQNSMNWLSIIMTGWESEVQPCSEEFLVVKGVFFLGVFKPHPEPDHHFGGWNPQRRKILHCSQLLCQLSRRGASSVFLRVCGIFQNGSHFSRS